MVKKSSIKIRTAFLLISALIIILFSSMQFTIAWLADSTKPVTNTFGIGEVPPVIYEYFNGVAKTDAGVRNTGNVPAFIRVKLIPVWTDGKGNLVALPVSGTYSLSVNETGWTLADDGYYYCNTAVAAGAESPVLVNSCTVTVDPVAKPEYDGMSFELQIIASSIQSEGWGDGVTNAQSAFAAAK